MGRFSSRIPVMVSAENLGALEIALALGLMLYGTALTQGYIYYKRSSGDRRFLKIFVGVLLFLETAHSTTTIHTIYYITVTKASHPTANSYPLSGSVVVETLITVLVQCYFVFRIYKLSGRLTIPFICWLFSMSRFIGGMALGVESFLDVPRQPDGFWLLASYGWLITASLTVGAAADILIAASMCFYLRRLASPTNQHSTAAILDRLIFWSIQTGLVTSLASVASIICFQAMENLVWLAVYMILAKLYSNSMLVSLNVRPRKRDFHHSGRQSKTTYLTPLEVRNKDTSLHVHIFM